VTTEIDKNKNLEIEIKIKIDNIETLREKIRTQDFCLVEHNTLEHNIVFDTKEQRLKKNKCLLRLRRKNNKYILTFKRPPAKPLKSKKYKVREETEVEVSDFENTAAIIRALGFDVFFVYEKYREVYKRKDGNVKIMMDQTPIGDFIEIEGSAKEIDQTASALGFTRKDYITANYYTLFRETHKTGHMLFR
jgi:adenylate cyclase class 2